MLFCFDRVCLCKNFITIVFVRNAILALGLRGSRRILFNGRSINSDGMSVLNVAEKNDVAKHVAGYLSGGNVQRREGFSKFNKIYEFECPVQGQQRKMVMTSVSGHLLSLDFTSNYKKWSSCSPADLFDAPVQKFCPADFEPIKRTLEREVQGCNMLIIWTDCDREGENIGYEIISVCKAVKPNLKVLRAKFSEITVQSIRRAMASLGPPNERVSQAVEVRTELDLRIGAAFTRFQTLRLQRVFPEALANLVISYGSCQFPTLGFVVERYKAIERFVPEPFWKIQVSHDVDDVKVDFLWSRVRLFEETVCRALYERCLESPQATVESVVSKPKSKWRPLPLDTVEFEKVASRKLRLNAKDAMAAAEKLYTKGLISYPRTETNTFPKDLNLVSLVEMQTENHQWGGFARRVLEDGPNPRQGKKSDNAHPPIHPTKAIQGLQGAEAKVYEFVVRHFLACVSKDAEAHQTVVTIDINGEKFVGSGLMILARNYLDVYIYDHWADKQMHMYSEGQVFRPTELQMVDGQTSPPKLLTEADLIALMEKHGIGTDATHAEHIEKIKSREYVGLTNEQYFVPGLLGMGLVDGYDDMGFNMSKPELRAELEADLVRISNGEKDPQAVLAEQVAKYKEVFRLATAQVEKIDTALAKYLNTAPIAVTETHVVSPEVTRCRRCQGVITVKQRPNNNGWYLGCQGYPQCRVSVWLPATVLSVEVDDSTCPQCGPVVRRLRFVFRPGSMAPYYPNSHLGCLYGCDPQLLEMLGVQSLATAASGQDRPAGQNQSPFSSGYSSLSTNNLARPMASTRTHFQNSFVDGSSDTEGPDNRPRGNNRSLSHSDDVCCTCGIPAKKLKVMKESVNKGRFFFTCSKPVEEKCDFFQWADDDGGGGGGGGGGDDRWGGGGGGRGSRGRGSRGRQPSQFRSKPYNSDLAPKRGGGRGKRGTRTPSVRLCKLCLQPGHNRASCPMEHT